MPIDFPISGLTANVTTYTYNGVTWKWNGSAWEKQAGVTGHVRTLNGFTGDVNIVAGAGITLTAVSGAITVGVVNITGPTGPIGFTGATGPQGNTGPTGPVGDYVSYWNGQTGAVTFSNYVASFGGKTGTVGAGITSGQILYWSGNDVTGSNNFTFVDPHEVVLAEPGHFTGRLLGAVLVPVKNTGLTLINKGDPVYAVGSVGASGEVEVMEADASISEAMPAIGLADTDLAHNAEGHAVVFGVIKNVNTDAYTINQTVFVAPGGGITGIRPTGANDQIQNIGRVVRVQASTGEILVSAIGRANDVPNIVQVRSWLQMPDGMTATGLVKSFNGLTGAVTGVASFNGSTGTVVFSNYVSSFNGLTGAVTGVTTSVANTFTALQSFNAGISASSLYVSGGITAAGATFNGPISGPTGSVTFGKLDLANSGLSSKNFTVPVTIHKTYLDNPEVGGLPGTNTENKVPITVSYTTDPTAEASDVLIGLYDATGATYSTRIKTTGIQTGTVTATSFNGTLNGSVNATDGNRIFTDIFETPESNANDPPPVFTFIAATDADSDFSGLLDPTTVLQMGFAGATFSTNVYAPNLVNSVNGLTGALTVSGGTGMSVLSAGKGITLVNTGVLSVNGSTGAITNVARTNVDNNFTTSQTVTNGLDFTTYGVNEIHFYDDISASETFLYASASGVPQTVTLPGGVNTTLAGLANTQTFTAVNTFSSVANFNAGISASGGVTFTQNITIRGLIVGSTGSNLLFATSAGAGMTGTNNMLFGLSAGRGIVAQSDNIAIGNDALRSTTPSSRNVALGTNALLNNTRNDCVAIGQNALSGNVGLYVVGLGTEAGLNNSGGNVMALGYNTLRSNAANSQIGIGPYALYQNTSSGANNNIAIGVNALWQNSGLRNTAIGNDAFIGSASYLGQSGNRNVGIGFETGLNNRTGSDNVFIGALSGRGITSGSNNIYIGSGVSAAASGLVTNEIIIGTNMPGAGSNTTTIGTASTTATRLFGVVASGVTAPTIASAGTIAPTTPIVFVSGTTTINTITAPTGIASTGGQIVLIPTGLWSTGTSGNIALATTAVVNRALVMVYDAGTVKWYPSY